MANKWTSEQDNVLIEQKKKGETYEAIQLKLPSKSVTAIASRARGLKLTVKTVSFIQGAAILKDLQAVLDGTAEFKDVKNKYSSSVTPGSLRVRLCRLR